MKTKTILKHPLFYIILAAIILRILIILTPTVVWWDSAEYIGIGKYLYSGGQIGIQEEFRPLLWPLILGAFWKIGLNPLTAGIILDFLFSIAVIFLTYKIAEKIINKRAGLIASVLVTISPILIYYSSKVLTENLALLLSLFAVYLFIEKRSFFAGVLIGLSFLARYPQAILLAVFVLCLVLLSLFDRDSAYKNFIKSSKLVFGFFLATVNFFIYNLLKYKDPFHLMKQAMPVVENADALWQQPVYFYFIALLSECFLFLVIIYSFYKMIKDRGKILWLVFLIAFSFLLYYQTVLLKEVRYLIVALPFLYILASYGIESLFNKKILRLVFYASIIILLFTSYFFINNQMTRFDRPAYEDVVKDFDKNELFTEDKYIIGSGPQIAAYSDAKVQVMEVAVYNSYLNMNPDFFSLYTCDFYCASSGCEDERANFLNTLKEKRTLIFNKKTAHCEYLLYQ
ncbi:glycosyltransferase family 39 protein [Candidatus Woesearchaeota archaeon]|nr:glycosyltransferase family 39 protein [Candidatus Woesearchaeota archaeon]